eukprot:CAMPEP_0180285518 /NCGR_PEP_ID=MMETSP0988-20121125/11958_1 /TAXON_ID=697907 /ORGANISM="non described non described, Strain CCMP2293" /LENGTH=129 /DNA_ID=CAMNT_0022258935 /DNA_START=109 /DNA_END=497 /DNA_ORIENTATION=-
MELINLTSAQAPAPAPPTIPPAAEIAGGWLVWRALREGAAPWQGVVGSVFLVAYGLVATLQPQSLDFGRVYAAYGGVFIAMSMAWGVFVDKTLLIDTGDIIGTILSIAGAALICFWPRATSPPVETTPT